MYSITNSAVKRRKIEGLERENNISEMRENITTTTVTTRRVLAKSGIMWAINCNADYGRFYCIFRKAVNHSNVPKINHITLYMNKRAA